MRRCDSCPVPPDRLCWCQHAQAGAVCRRQARDPRFALKVIELTEAMGHRDPDADAYAYAYDPPCPTTPAPPGSISVIVAARNNGPYLADALASALRQSQPALEVIYADDGSTDDSLTIARQFPEVRVLSGPHRGVADARNRACAIARGEYLLHLDGDDVLPSNYLAARLAAIQRDPAAAFAYGPAQCFGSGQNHLWEAPAWEDDSPARLWVTNWINTSTLIRADAFHAVGGWQEGIGTAWDWDLFLRLARAGYRGVLDREGRLLYRQHAASVSKQDARQDEGTGPPFARNAYLERVHHARTAIGCVLSDRLLDLFPRWLDALSATIADHAAKLAAERPYGRFGRIDAPLPSLHLHYTGDRSHLPAIRRALEGHAPELSELALTWSPQSPLPTDPAARNRAVSTLLARSYNRLLGSMESDVVWWIEDDILVPPNALHDLKRALLSPSIPRPAVAGWYRSRHADPHLLAHDGAPGSIRVVPAIAADLQPVDLTGTGCLMVFRPFAGHSFAPLADGTIPAHDWRWCRDLAGAELPSWQAGGERRPVLVASVACAHHRTVSEAVTVDAPTRPSPSPILREIARTKAEVLACPERFDPESSCQCHARCRRLGGRRLAINECVTQRQRPDSGCPSISC